MFPELDEFLCGDLAVALANIQYYLNYDVRDAESKLLPEKIDQIVIYLNTMENLAIELADSLSPRVRSAYCRSGVVPALRSIQRLEDA